MSKSRADEKKCSFVRSIRKIYDNDNCFDCESQIQCAKWQEKNKIKYINNVSTSKWNERSYANERIMLNLSLTVSQLQDILNATVLNWIPKIRMDLNEHRLKKCATFAIFSQNLLFLICWTGFFGIMIYIVRQSLFTL